MFLNGVDLLTLLDLDLPVNYELTCSYINVVATATLEVFHKEARVIGPVIELEAGFCKTVKDWLIVLGDLLGRISMPIL